MIRSTMDPKPELTRDPEDLLDDPGIDEDDREDPGEETSLQGDAEQKDKDTGEKNTP